MDDALLFNIVRIYLECAVVFNVMIVLQSDGKIKVSDLILIMLFWPVLLIAMILPPQDRDGDE